ncbi:hypothetical protein KW477_00275 [Vibrio fluvialis]|nr:hypothetical protein [Vibrio fluvialis]
MVDIKARINSIKKHLEENTETSLLLAALEARLTIEMICYDRFKQNDDYISQADLVKWNPGDIVAQVANEVSSSVNEAFTLRIARYNPGDPKPENPDDFDKQNPIVVGKQSKIKLSEAKSIWNALSRVALHLHLSNYEQYGIYGNGELIKKKVIDAINLLEGVSEGNLLLGGSFKPSENFECITCHTKIRKFFDKLPMPSVISCTNPKCMESYLIEINEDDKFQVTRYSYKFTCEGCGNHFEVPHRSLDGLTHKEQINITCNSCGTGGTITMLPNYTNIKEMK